MSRYAIENYSVQRDDSYYRIVDTQTQKDIYFPGGINDLKTLSRWWNG